MYLLYVFLCARACIRRYDVYHLYKHTCKHHASNLSASESYQYDLRLILCTRSANQVVLDDEDDDDDTLLSQPEDEADGSG